MSFRAFLIFLFGESNGISSRFSEYIISRRLYRFRNDDILARKRDILVFGRMICNFYEIDDIQGSRLDCNVRIWYNTQLLTDLNAIENDITVDKLKGGVFAVNCNFCNFIGIGDGYRIQR